VSPRPNASEHGGGADWARAPKIATLEHVDWFNHKRLYGACGDIPPAELEAAYYSQNTALAEAGHSTK